jgi:hypothetical protein
MKKIVFLILTLPLIAACDGMPRKKSFTSATCVDGGGDPIQMQGYTKTAIAYGDSYLVVIPVSKIRPNTEFRFWLAPEARSSKDAEYEAAWVSISGGKVESDGTITAASWLDVSGQLSATVEMLIACVPSLAVGDTYKFKVTISDKELTDASAVTLGYIDPRADVVDW